MNKWDALAKFAGIVSKPKHVKKMICSEVCDMMEAWKADHFAPSTKELDSLSDADFLAIYKKEFYQTAQHEAAETIWYVVKFFEAHDIDIMPYVDALEKERELTMPNVASNVTSSAPAVRVIMP